MEGKSKIVELQEELLVALLDVTQKRKEMPKRCASLLARNLESQLSIAEKAVVLPKTNVKNLLCKHPLEKPLKTTFNLPKGEISVKHIPSLITQLHKDNENISKVLDIYNLSKKKVLVPD